MLSRAIVVAAVLLAMMFGPAKSGAQVGTNHYYAWVAGTVSVKGQVHLVSVTDYDSSGTRMTRIAEYNRSTGLGFATTNPATAQEITSAVTTATTADYKGNILQGKKLCPFTLSIRQSGTSWLVSFTANDPKTGRALVSYSGVPFDAGSVVTLSP